MNREDRKAAVAAYKERKSPLGVFAVRCLATGQCWVGGALDVSAIQNRLWFSLQHGSHRATTLQAAWTAHAREQFTFEELERLPEDTFPGARARLLKERQVHWCAELGALAL